MNKFGNGTLIARHLCKILSLTILIASTAQAQTRAIASNDNQSDAAGALALVPRYRLSLVPAGYRLMSATSLRINTGLHSNANVTLTGAGPTLQVLGSGTVGRLPKWTSLTGSNSFIGDSIIFEDKFGNVGIGKDSPTSKLTVAGMIETTLGGLKFPDGTVQTTAGLASLFHNATLQGNGTGFSPLSVAVPLSLTAAVSDNGAFAFAIIRARNTAEAGIGVIALGGAGGSQPNARGGTGIFGFGGDSGSLAGNGMEALGGAGSVKSGDGVHATGGDGSVDGIAGSGVTATGGANTTRGGTGLAANGGVSPDGFGGIGVSTFGGNGAGAGNTGGSGIFAIGGSGLNGATHGTAGEFSGTLEVNGNLDVLGSKNFKIDHPLDPENKYLYHAAIESSEVLNVYSGNVTTNENGEVIVTMPDWFEALNSDFRYQLTSIGAPAHGLYIAEKVNKNRFKIAGGQPGMEVSWQVTGVRSDAVMLKHPFKAEENKPERERGTYLSPEAFGQLEEKGVEWARHPQIMLQMKETRLKQVEDLKQKTQSNDR